MAVTFDRNGWYPNVFASGDRAWVSYGNGQCRLLEAQIQPDGTLTEIRHALLDGVSCWSGQWIRPFVLAAWKERTDVGKDYWELLELDVRGEWTLRSALGPSQRVGGNFFAAADGHSAGVNLGIAALDGVAVDAAGNGVATGGGAIIFPDREQPIVCRAFTGTPVERYTAQTGLAQVAAGPDARIAYGGFGPVRGIVNGHDIDLTVTPWRQEWLGGGGKPEMGRVIWSRPDGSMWVATSAHHPSFTGLLLRPWGALECVQIPVNADHFSIAETGPWWVISVCDETGHASLMTCPTSTLRRPVTVTNVPPPPPPPDPQPEPDPEPIMPPDHRHIVNAVHAKYPQLLQANTYATCREFVWRAVEALAQADPHWGFLTKQPGENHVVIKGHAVAVDAVTYQGWDGAVDIISGSTSGEPTSPSWSEEGKRPSNVWLKAFPFDEGTSEPPADDPDPVPPADVQAIAVAVASVINPKIEDLEEGMADEFAKVYRELQLIRTGVQQVLDRPVPVPDVTAFPNYQASIDGALSRLFGTITLKPVPPKQP